MTRPPRPEELAPVAGGTDVLHAIADASFGLTVEFDRPLPAHSRALMDALGVNVVYARRGCDNPGVNIRGNHSATARALGAGR